MTLLLKNKNTPDPFSMIISTPTWHSLSHIANKYYSYLLTQIGDIDTSSRIIENPHERFSFALTHLKKGMAIDRLLFRCLKFLKGHAGALRRGSGKPVKIRDCGFVLASIDDLIVALREIHFDDVAEEMVKFYDEYLGALSTNGINPKLFEDDEVAVSYRVEEIPKMAVVIPVKPEPPKYKTLSWYLAENYESFFTGKTIRFLKGDRAYENCIIRSFGVDSTLCNYGDALIKTPNDIPLTWG